MNVAALVSGPVVDACTILYKDKDATANNQQNINQEGTEDYVPKEWSLTGYRAVVLTGIMSNVIAVLVALTVREIKLEAPPNLKNETNGAILQRPEIENEFNNHSNDNSLRDVDRSVNDPLTKDIISSSKEASIATFTPIKGSAWSILKETLQTKSFWRFLAVCLITINVRMIFRHLDATLPKYMMREFGDDVPKGTIYSINPALIIVLVPIVTAATSQVEPLVMIHYGSYISAFSVFFLVMSTSVTACVFFVIILSIGEAVWSPRLYDYTMSVCQEGREGTYMALSSAPLFLAKLPVGFMSGYLLQKYCPEEGSRNSKMMWLIIGATTVVSPVLLTIFWKYVSYKDNDEFIGDSGDFDQESNPAIRYTELAEQQHPPESPLLKQQSSRVSTNSATSSKKL